MATILHKPIHREMICNGHLAGRDVGRVIVTLEPGDILTFRQKGKRTRYSVPLQACMNLALMNYLVENYQKKMNNYSIKKKAGLGRPKRPRKPNISVFSPILVKALKIA